MLGKIKNIKKYIRLAKKWGIIFALLFLSMLWMIIFQQFQILDLKEKVTVLQEYLDR